jgi:hypothetical protein
MAGSAAPRVTTHRLAPEEASALAWMLEVTAHQCWMIGDFESATGLEGGSVALRLAAFHSDEFEIAISDLTIDDMTTIAWDLLDRIAEDAQLIADEAEPEWAEIGAGLLTRDQTGGAFTQFLMECPRPVDLPTYAASVVSRLRSKAEVELVVEA